MVLIVYGLYGCASVTLAFGGHRVHHYYHEAPPAGWVGLYGLLVIAVCSTFMWMGIPLVGPHVGVPLGVLFAMPAVIVMALMTGATVAELMTGFLYGQHFVTPGPSDFGRARKKANEGDLEGALREYRAYFEAEPRRRAALFAAAMLAEQKEKFDYAVTFYKDIMRQFEKHPQAWARAAYRLALIHDQHFHDTATAARLMREVMTRARRSDEARDAANYLTTVRPDAAH